jgi:hypothetical protein
VFVTTEHERHSPPTVLSGVQSRTPSPRLTNGVKWEPLLLAFHGLTAFTVYLFRSPLSGAVAPLPPPQSGLSFTKGTAVPFPFLHQQRRPTTCSSFVQALLRLVPDVGAPRFKSLAEAPHVVSSLFFLGLDSTYRNARADIHYHLGKIMR